MRRRSRHAACRALAIAATVAASWSMLGGASVAGATADRAISCKAYMSNVDPRQRTRVLVYVHTEKIAAIRAAAHFRSGNVVRATRANKYGNAALVFAVGRAPRGVTVHVAVRVSLGSARGYCFTAFTPK